jgi:pimeloyl-ACP methyl ester carboxylesterase
MVADSPPPLGVLPAVSVIYRLVAAMALTPRAQAWQERGTRVPALGGHQVHVVRRDGERPELVLLHGFPSSSYDWRALWDDPILAGRAVLAFDFLGFGLSDKPPGGMTGVPGKPYSLMTQADLAEELVARYTDGPVFVVAHDMGTSVATELFAREIEGKGRIQFAGAVLFNGSMLLHLAKPTIGQQLLRSRAGPLAARLSTGRFFRQQLGSVFSPEHRLSPEEAADQWSLVTHLDGHRRAHELVGYMDERIRLADRWHGAIRDWPGNLSLLWAMKDPVARTEVLRGLQDLRPGVPVTELADLGHYPQIEDPGRVAAVIADYSRPAG